AEELAALAALGAWWLVLRARRRARGRSAWLAGAALALGAGVLAKENVATIPAVVLAADAIVGPGVTRARAAESVALAGGGGPAVRDRVQRVRDHRHGDGGAPPLPALGRVLPAGGERRGRARAAEPRAAGGRGDRGCRPGRLLRAGHRAPQPRLARAAGLLRGPGGERSPQRAQPSRARARVQRPRAARAGDRRARARARHPAGRDGEPLRPGERPAACRALDGGDRGLPEGARAAGGFRP